MHCNDFNIKRHVTTCHDMSLLSAPLASQYYWHTFTIISVFVFITILIAVVIMFFYIIIIIIIVIIVIFIIYVYNMEDLPEGDHMEDVALLKDILYFTFVEKIRVFNTNT